MTFFVQENQFELAMTLLHIKYLDVFVLKIA
jgi:hypothetical protein